MNTEENVKKEEEKVEEKVENVKEEDSSGNEEVKRSDLVLGEEFNKMVDGICEMGFNREETVIALRVAFNNPERAIE